MIDAAGERSEQGRFVSRRPGSSNAMLGGTARSVNPPFAHTPTLPPQDCRRTVRRATKYPMMGATPNPSRGKGKLRIRATRTHPAMYTPSARAVGAFGPALPIKNGRGSSPRDNIAATNHGIPVVRAMRRIPSTWGTGASGSGRNQETATSPITRTEQSTTVRSRIRPGSARISKANAAASPDACAASGCAARIPAVVVMSRTPDIARLLDSVSSSPAAFITIGREIAPAYRTRGPS